MVLLWTNLKHAERVNMGNMLVGKSYKGYRPDYVMIEPDDVKDILQNIGEGPVVIANMIEYLHRISTVLGAECQSNIITMS